MSTSSAERSFDLSYRLTVEDYIAMMNRYWVMSRGRRLRVLFLQLAVFATGLHSVFRCWLYGDWIDGAAAVVLLSAPLTVPLINKLVYRRHYDKQRLGEGEVHLRADGAAARVTWVAADMRVPWTNVRSVDFEQGRTFIWMSAAQAIIVPRAAFASDAEAASFADWARGRFAAAHGSEAVPA